jgi:hypothetical protein
VARVAAAAAVASETYVRSSLEATRQSAEDRATTAETAAATVATERDSLASRLALTEAEVKKLRAAAASAEEAAERARPLRTQPRLLPGTPPRPLLARRRHSKQGCWSWSVTWARP